MGLREQIVFPEIDYDKVDQIRGLDVTICTTAKTDEEGRALLLGFNLPFGGAARAREEAEKAEKAKAEALARAEAEAMAKAELQPEEAEAPSDEEAEQPQENTGEEKPATGDKENG